jgi:SM-20-related protein
MNSEREDALERNQFEHLIQGLIQDQYGCCDDFILPASVLGLRANMTHLNAEGNLKFAGISNKNDFQTNKLIRGDKVNWIEDQSTNSFEAAYLKKIWRFINHLNATCFTSILTFVSHYAKFESGSFYKRHIDQFKTDNGRKYSIVLYLNEDWKLEDDGLLSLYPLNRIQVNIAPIAGRMVFFSSDEMEHEVHPSLTRERNSIAGWLKG